MEILTVIFNSEFLCILTLNQPLLTPGKVKKKCQHGLEGGREMMTDHLLCNLEQVF